MLATRLRDYCSQLYWWPQRIVVLTYWPSLDLWRNSSVVLQRGPWRSKRLFLLRHKQNHAESRVRPWGLFCPSEWFCSALRSQNQDWSKSKRGYTRRTLFFEGELKTDKNASFVNILFCGKLQAPPPPSGGCCSKNKNYIVCLKSCIFRIMSNR